MKCKNAVFLVLGILSYACVSAPKPSSGLAKDPHKSTPKPKGSPKGPEIAPAPAPAAPIPCFAAAQTFELPLIAPNLVVTRIGEQCELATGAKGYLRDAKWMVMGFPCTGGPGRMSYEGNFNNPNALSFHLSNSCPMSPRTSMEAEAITARLLGLGTQAKMVAYYPFAPLFWEFSDWGEADVGTVLTLRSAKAVREVWKAARDSKAVPVKIYGRENIWLKGGIQDFIIHADLIPSQLQRNFRLSINKIEPASTATAKSIWEKCQALQPPRDCQAIESAIGEN